MMNDSKLGRVRSRAFDVLHVFDAFGVFRVFRTFGVFGAFGAFRAFGALRGRWRALATIVLASMPVVALAHVSPQHETPSAGAEGPAPANVTIVFDGPLEPAFSKLTVTSAAGKAVTTAQAQVDPNDRKTIRLALPRLAPDKYVVHWVAVASDGHRTQGDYTFRVK